VKIPLIFLSGIMDFNNKPRKDISERNWILEPGLRNSMREKHHK
jgi:hypothetical protein